MNKLISYLFCLIVIMLLQSCETYKNVPYFMDLPDTARMAIINAPYKELRIQPDDILNISVQTIDANTTSTFNQPVSSSSGSSGLGAGSDVSMTSASGGISNNLSGYLVNKKGEVELPILGSFRLAGLTTSDARDSIQNRAAIYFKSASVYVRFANLKVTVLGEVQKPGTYVLPSEKNTILDALGLAGDLTIFGKRENALLIRDSAGQSQLIRFSLNSKDLLKKDFFYLKQNDIVYIEPNKSKVASQDAIKTRNYSLIASALTILIVIISRIN